MKHSFSLFFLLALLWLGNSGHYTPLLLGIGVFSCLFVMWVAQRMNLVDHESQPLNLGWGIFGYLGWLTAKVVSSNVAVVGHIWRGNGSISPSVARLPLSQSTDMGRVIYANSITLTPGTVAMDMDDGSVVVHALTEAGVQELEQGEMNRRVARLEE